MDAVMPATRAAPESQLASLYVGDLHPAVTEAMLYDIFSTIGSVASIRVCRDSLTRKPLGYAYVNYDRVADAETALSSLNYTNIKGRACRIMRVQRDPSSRTGGDSNIYVKNLDTSIDNKALYDTFSQFGSILSCKVASDNLGKSYGYGFVHYESAEAAKQAIERVNGMRIGGKTVHVSAHVAKIAGKNPNPAETFTNLYVKNIPKGFDEERLRELCAPSGEVTSILVRTDPRGRDFAFVNFKTHEEAQRCIDALHRKDMRSEAEIEEAKSKATEAGKEDESAGGDESHLLYVQRTKSKKERQQELQSRFGVKDNGPGGVNLFVKNLSEDMNEDSLRELFGSFGTITSVAVPKDENGVSKGFGFVCFQSPDEATRAVTEMHLKMVKCKPLFVGLAEKREERQERLRKGAMFNAAHVGTGKGKGKAAYGQSDLWQQGFGYMGCMGGMFGMPGQSIGLPDPNMPAMGMPGMDSQQVAIMQQEMMQHQMAMLAASGDAGMLGMAGMMGMDGMMLGMGMPLAGVPLGKGMPVMMQPDKGSAAMMSGAPVPAGTGSHAPAPNAQKQMLGEQLYAFVSRIEPELAGKIVGMILEMDIGTIRSLLDSEKLLRTKIREAVQVLR